MIFSGNALLFTKTGKWLPTKKAVVCCEEKPPLLRQTCQDFLSIPRATTFTGYAIFDPAQLPVAMFVSVPIDVQVPLGEGQYLSFPAILDTTGFSGRFDSALEWVVSMDARIEGVSTVYSLMVPSADGIKALQKAFPAEGQHPRRPRTLREKVRILSDRGSAFKRLLKHKLAGGQPTAPCCFCGRVFQVTTLTLEHIIPRSEGGTWNLNNLRLSCSPCNSERGTQPFFAFKAKYRRLRQQLRGGL